MKEETAVAEKRDRKAGDKNTVKVLKTLKPDAIVVEGLARIRANTDVSLSDEEIKSILREKQTPKRRNLMRTVELRLKEKTVVAEKRGREVGDKNTVRSLTLTIKEMRPETNKLDLFKQIKKTAGSDFSLNDTEIKTITHQNLKQGRRSAKSVGKI